MCNQLVPGIAENHHRRISQHKMRQRQAGQNSDIMHKREQILTFSRTEPVDCTTVRNGITRRLKAKGNKRENASEQRNVMVEKKHKENGNRINAEPITSRQKRIMAVRRQQQGELGWATVLQRLEHNCIAQQQAEIETINRHCRVNNVPTRQRGE